MPIALTTDAVERSTYAITVSFFDDAGASVVPNAGLTWSLLKSVAGVVSIVNGRIAVPIASAEMIKIALTDADLALTVGEARTRWLLLEGTYDSTFGTGLAIRETIEFSITNLIGV